MNYCLLEDVNVVSIDNFGRKMSQSVCQSGNMSFLFSLGFNIKVPFGCIT
jgi:hypothetical protein